MPNQTLQATAKSAVDFCYASAFTTVSVSRTAFLAAAEQNVRNTSYKRGRMGVSIHYCGKLDNTDRLPEFRERLMNIALSSGWQYLVLDEDWSVPAKATLEHNGESAEITGHLGLKGIQLKPLGESEPIDFFFNSKGYLLSPMNVILVQEGVLAIDDAWITVKTQFLPPEMHVMIIGLLKYIKEHYLHNLEVQDEGEYWETGDYLALENKMKVIQEKINYLSHELSSEYFGGMAGLSADEIAERIEQLFCAEDVKPRYDN